MNIIDERILDSNGQLTTRRKKSPEDWHAIYRSKVGELDDIKEIALPESNQKKPSALKQFFIYLKRNVKAKLADRQFLAIALLEAPVLALIVARLSRYEGEDGYTLFENINMISFLLWQLLLLYLWE